MYKTGQVLQRKATEENTSLPEEVKIEEIIHSEAETKITISSEKGTFESTTEILSAFYDLKEEMTEENLPKIVLEKIQEISQLFDIYGATGSPEAGIKVKTELMRLSEEIKKVTGDPAEETLVDLLGKKVS